MLECSRILASRNEPLHRRPVVWALNADVDMLWKSTAGKFYGPAAEPMRKFWLAAGGTSPGTRRRRTRPTWSRPARLLGRAGREPERGGKRVAGAPQRFRDRVQFNRDGF